MSFQKDNMSLGSIFTNYTAFCGVCTTKTFISSGKRRKTNKKPSNIVVRNWTERRVKCIFGINFRLVTAAEINGSFLYEGLTLFVGKYLQSSLNPYKHKILCNFIVIASWYLENKALKVLYKHTYYFHKMQCTEFDWRLT